MLWTSYDTKDTLDLLPIDSENQSINYSYNGIDIECRLVIDSNTSNIKYFQNFNASNKRNSGHMV